MGNKNRVRQVVSKRFKCTKTGKIKRKMCNTSHLNRKDDVSSTIRKKKLVTVKGKFALKIKKMLSA